MLGMETRLREVRLGALPDIKNLQRHYCQWMFKQVSPPETGTLNCKTFTLTVLLNGDPQKKKTSTPKINEFDSVLLLYIDI